MAVLVIEEQSTGLVSNISTDTVLLMALSTMYLCLHFATRCTGQQQHDVPGRQHIRIIVCMTFAGFHTTSREIKFEQSSTWNSVGWFVPERRHMVSELDRLLVISWLVLSLLTWFFHFSP